MSRRALPSGQEFHHRLGHRRRLLQCREVTGIPDDGEPRVPYAVRDLLRALRRGEHIAIAHDHERWTADRAQSAARVRPPENRGLLMDESLGTDLLHHRAPDAAQRLIAPTARMHQPGEEHVSQLAEMAAAHALDL